MVRRIWQGVAISAAAMALGGCGARTPAAGAANAAAGGPTLATVVAVRPAPPAEARSFVLAALGAGATGGGADTACEVILRDAGGHILSVMQPQSGAVRVGEQVLVVPGPHTRLARAGSPPPPA